MTYEQLLAHSDEAGLVVREKPLKYNDGRIKGNRIAIRQNIETQKEKACVLAEELGHHYTSSGNILDQTKVENVKQEQRARMWAYNKRIGLSGLLEAFKHHCSNRYEIAEYLGVSEDTLAEALEYYRQIYGTGTMIENYFIQFEPHLQVYEYFPVK